VIDQVAQRVFESAGDELPLQVNGQEAWAGIDVFVTGHVLLSRNVSSFEP
jgi:hypothetical protein